MINFFIKTVLRRQTIQNLDFNSILVVNMSYESQPKKLLTFSMTNAKRIFSTIWKVNSFTEWNTLKLANFSFKIHFWDAERLHASSISLILAAWRWRRRSENRQCVISTPCRRFSQCWSFVCVPNCDSQEIEKISHSAAVPCETV